MSRNSDFSAAQTLNIFVYVSLLIVLFFTLLNSPLWVSRLFSPVQVQQGEAVNLEFGRILASGQTLYPDVRQGGPYLHCSYPPLFPFLESKLLKLTRNPWLPGRLLALGGYLGCGFLLGIAGWKKWGLSPWTILLPFWLWLSPTWILWGTMIRLDTLMIFLNFCAFLILYWLSEQKSEKGSRYYWMGAGLLNAAAILMKSTALTLTLSVVIWALWKRRWKELGFFLLWALGPVLITGEVLQKTTHGMYWLDTVEWSAVGFSMERLSYFIFHRFLLEAGWLLILVLLTVRFKKIPSFLKIQLLLSFLSLWTLCREGSAENYYLEFILYGLWAISEGWASRGLEVQNIGVPFGVSTIVGSLLLIGSLVFGLTPNPMVPSQNEINMKMSVLPIYEHGSYHLALDEDLPVMAGKSIWYQPSGILPIIKTGKWNPAPLLRDIHNHKFATIEFYDLPHQYLYPPMVEQAVLENYKVRWKAYGRVWYIPQK